MLKHLLIEQFVIIEKFDLDLEDGLTIFTGETGAGKSILLDALGLLLGDPPNPEAIRQGADRSIMAARFTPPQDNSVWAFLSENNITVPAGGELVIKRILKPDGEDDITVGETAVELEMLRQIGMHLSEIHGQFANQSMLAPENQLNLLDLSGDFPPEVFDNVANALREVNRYKQELEDEKAFQNEHKSNMGAIERVVKRFDAIGMHETLVEEAHHEYDILLTAKDSSEAFQAILSLFIAGNGVVSALSNANNILQSSENLDGEKTQDLAKFLSGSLDNARKAVNEMRRLQPEYEIDLEPLKRYEEMLTVMHDIGEENGIEMQDLYAFYHDMATTLDRLKNGRERLAELEGLLQKSKAAYLHHANILSEWRVSASKALSESITAELPPLRLNKAEFKVDVNKHPHGTWTEKGFDEVVFTARMNPGMPFSPVSETASGGELARLILGLKVVLQRVQTIPTLVFDEIDVGIGGAAAAAVGERIACLADDTQVLVITHSPQVASRGDRHLFVSKSTDGVTTTSVVHKLTHEERVSEISNMLAGDESTDQSRAAAESLIAEAVKAATVRKAQLLEEQKRLEQEAIKIQQEREKLQAAQAATAPGEADAAMDEGTATPGHSETADSPDTANGTGEDAATPSALPPNDAEDIITEDMADDDLPADSPGQQQTGSGDPAEQAASQP